MTIFKFTISIILSFWILLLTSCSEKPKLEQTKEKHIEYIRYFHKRTLIPNKGFKYIKSFFEDEIKGSKYEIIRKLKAIEIAKGYFYKVFYNKRSKITKYKLFKKGKLVYFSIYHYGDRNTILSDKITKIEYYNSNNDMLAYERISYNKFAHAIEMNRYDFNGKIVNIF